MRLSKHAKTFDAHCLFW